MFYSTVLLAATAMTGLASAQSPWTFSTNYSTSGPIAINPATVDSPTRQSWCRAETNSCGQLCGQYSANTCDPDTLVYNCTCTSGITPNISNYQQTLPSLICEQWRADCTNAHPNDLDGITACQSVTCGSANASSARSSSSSSAASSTTSSAASSSSAAASTTAGAASGSATSASASASATSTGAAAALSVAKTYGTGALAAGMLAVFGLAL